MTGSGPADPEETLSGGNLSTIVRVGDTVRRPSGPWTPAVHALLEHLERKGFEEAPRAQGLDDQDREILTFVAGEGVGTAQPWPGWCWTDDTVVEAGRMLRRYHDAVEDFEPPADARWRLDSKAAQPGEIICHNDVAPYNLVRRPDGRLSLIDWDVAGPGLPRDDVTFAARAFAPLHPDDLCAKLGFAQLEDRPRRLRLLLDAYGFDDRQGFIDHVQARLDASIERITRAADSGELAFQNLIANGLLEPVRASQVWINAHRDELSAALA